MLTRAEITRRLANEDDVPMGVGEREALETAQTLAQWIEDANFSCIECVDGMLIVPSWQARRWIDER